MSPSSSSPVLPFIYSRRISVLARALACVMFPLLLSACSKAPAPGYRFEPNPRSLATVTGLAQTRYARLAVDSVASGTLYLLTATGEGESSRLTFLLSTDGGDTFGAPVTVSDKVSAHGESSPVLVGNPALYAAWNEGADLRFSRSLSWGSSFEAPVRITDRVNDAFSGYVSIGVGPEGDVYAVWIDTRDQSSTSENYSIYVARSTDHGATFGRNVRVAEKVCACCRPNLAFGPGGELLVFWRHVYPDNVRDMTVAVSRDHGATFSPPKRVAEDNWKIAGCPDSGLVAVRSGSRIYAAWLTEASADKSGVRMAWSDDAGSTWAPAILASQHILDANYPSIAADDDGHVVVVFQGRDPTAKAGWEATTPYVVDVDASGRPSAPMAVPGVHAPVARPTVTVGRGGRLFVAWTSTIDGKQTVLFSRGRRVAPGRS